MLGFLNKIFGDSNEREIRRHKPTVDQINSLEPKLEKLSDEKLKAKTREFKDRLAKGETLDDILPEAFAAVRESAKRTIGQRHFDVQLIAGIVLHQGKIAEQKTGEGKTLSATLSLYLNALEGKGCHLVTVNDYLARRDCAWMGPIYEKLGVSVSAINHEKSYLFGLNKKDEQPISPEMENLIPCSRAEAYAAEITYGTNNEFGFDYLRDNMAQDSSQVVQRPLNYAIVDEVDSILIDEARTPLIISAPAEQSAQMYAQFARMVPQLKKDEDYRIDEKMRAVTLTDQGMKKIETMLGVKNVYDRQAILMVHHLEEALKAYALFTKDKDYVVKDGEVIIVDEFTGRLMPGRRYSEGLHQAIEAKEGVEVKRESDTLATISFQNLFRLYNKLAGMTGTAATEAEEFYKIYKLDVVIVPTNKPMIRQDLEDKIYKTQEAKFRAIVGEIKDKLAKNQPVLVGTISIEKSEYLSRLLKRQGIKHEVLNAKHHEREAKIIAQAGRPASVTVATNMAGRGVDIVLGGNPPQEKNHEIVKRAGGLHVLGTERHEARRIDNQLRGRSGRQGDPGSSQFYVSTEDDLMRIFGGDRLKNIMERLHLPEDQPIKHSLISRSIESAQKKVEGHNFDIRKHLVEYDDVMNKHREAVYKKRRKILFQEDKEELHQEILNLFDESEKKDFEAKIQRYGIQTMHRVERAVYLRTIDVLWIEHLNAMEQLREGIGLRGYGQRDPLVEYKQEAYGLYNRLLREINNQVADLLLKVEMPRVPSPIEEMPQRPISLQGANESMAAGTFEQVPSAAGTPMAPGAEALGGNEEPSSGKNDVTVTVRTRDKPAQTVKRAYPKVGRNDPCPCGAKDPKTGKPIKYKKCHGR